MDAVSAQNLTRSTFGTFSVTNHHAYNHLINHKNKSVCIRLKWHDGGFWSIFNKLMNYLDTFNNIEKIEFNVCYPGGMSNLFYGEGDFFKTVFNEYIADDNKKLFLIEADNYITYTLTGSYANWLHALDQSWRRRYNYLFKKHIRIKEDVLSEYCIPDDMHIVSILVRHPALRYEQINGYMPSKEQYDSVIEKILKEHTNCMFIVATDVTEYIDYFNEKYKNYKIIHPESIKTSITHDEAQKIHNGDLNTSKIALNTVLLLAKGHEFIFPNSNMSTAALYINPEMISHFLIGKC